MGHPTETDLAALLRGELSPPASDAVAAHLDACRDCLATAERLTAVPEAVRAAVLVSAGVHADPVPLALLPRLGSYAEFRELGRGGCGIVYRAVATASGRAVAVKILRGGALASPAEREWFLSEAAVAAKLDHPHIIRVLAVGGDEALPYYVMEYAAGGSLARRVKGEPVGPAVAAGLVRTVAGAVHAAHSAGIIHRDLKPANILLGDDTFAFPLVTDFGMATRNDPAALATPTQAVLGTPNYMAPEQAFGGSSRVGPAADVYALGAILYELLTGRPPFRGGTPYETLLRVRAGKPEPPSRLRADVPPALDAVCLKCLAHRPTDRYPSAAALAEDLGRFGRGDPVLAPRPGSGLRLGRWARCRPRTAGAILLAAALAAGLVLTAGRSARRGETPGVDTRPPHRDRPFEPLFNGTDLTGWEVDGNPSGWFVEGGAIGTVPGVAPKRGWLYTTREFGDFELRFEFALSPGANSGVAVRGVPGGGGGNRTVLEIQVRDDTDGPPTAVTGCVFMNGPDYVDPPARARLHLPGVWNEMRVAARGTDVRIEANGALVHQVDLAKLAPSGKASVHEKWFGEANLRRMRGRLGFQYSPKPVRFRAIEVRELAAW